MTFRADDERVLLEAFIAWLVAAGWLKVGGIAKELVTEFLKSRAIQ